MQTWHSKRNRCAAFGRVMLKGELPACVAIVLMKSLHAC
jgi:hypothetical protein